MEIVYQKNKDKQPVYDMYQKIFEDPEPFAQYYFEEIYATNQVILAEEDNKILGMLHLNPFSYGIFTPPKIKSLPSTN